MATDKPPKNPVSDPDRKHQKAYGAQSDQGGAGQKQHGPEPQKPYYEGGEEHNQQRQAKGRAHYPYDGKEDEAQPGNLGHVGKEHDEESS